MTKNRRINHAVSEVLSVALLLGITIALFGFLNYIVFSFSFEPSAPSVNLIGSIDTEQKFITIEHYGGKPLAGETQIVVTIGNDTYKKTASELLFKDTWNFGDTVQFPYDDITDRYVQAVVIDPSTNTLILSTVLQQGLMISGGDLVWHYDPVISASSDVDSSADKGTENEFANAQDTNPDTNLMTIQESDYGNQIHNDDVDSNSTDVDSSADKGNETSFMNSQGIVPDANVMTLQESDYGTAVNENLVVDGFTATRTDWTGVGSSPYLNADDGANYITTIRKNDHEYWFTFANTTHTGSGFTVVMYVDFDAGDGNDDCNWYIDTTGDNIPEFIGTIMNPTTNLANTGIIVGLDNHTEINAARVWFEKIGSNTAPMTIDYASLTIQRAATINYNIDFEYQWTTANYSDSTKHLCFYVASAGTETLNVQYRNAGAWTTLGSITGTGWKNFTDIGLTSATYTIRLVGANEASDTIQDSWTIDCVFLNTSSIINYRIDLEYQWTNAHFNEQGKTVCMYFETVGSEILTVNYWNGMTWSNLGTISSSGWKNFTAAGLTAPTYTIQLKGATEASDTTRDTWTIDCIFLKSYTFS
ncbi:MAG: type IV pilin N-terminal domain-containing protein [Candidatus Thermoplasmatota archaeon]|nr:type IV pilin N-terminal domain-containing protein [Candidatus Thermoplasmatota archaeon]